MATATCLACGKPIVAVQASNHVVSLARVWVHYSWLANRTHNAIPKA